MIPVFPLGKPRYKPLIRQPIPEFPLSELEGVLEIIDDYRLHRMSSYGAYLLRGASLADAIGCQNFFDNRKRLWQDSHLEHVGNNVSIHRDRGRPSATTVHFTEQGEVDFMILPDAQLKLPLSQRIRRRTTEQLFEHGLVDERVVKGAERVLEAHLEEGSLLLFDHTLPHATVNPSENRISSIYYV